MQVSFQSNLLQNSPQNSATPRIIQEKCIFQQSADLNFKKFSFGVYHWATLRSQWLYSFFSENNILHKKQFGFQKQCSTDHTIVYLINEILKSFENNCYTLGVFIDLTKALDTVGHNILLKKLFHFGVRGNTLKLPQSYLHNRKQYIAYENSSKTEFKNVICDIPQDSILGPLTIFNIYK